MKAEVPGSIPGIFPLVGHGYHVVVYHVEPFPVPYVLPGPDGPDVGSMLPQPLVEIEIIVLLRPEHAGQRLTHHFPRFLIYGGRGDRIIKLVRLRFSRGHGLVEAPERVLAGKLRGFGREDEAHPLFLPAPDRERIMSGDLRTGIVGIYGFLPPSDYIVVDAV